MGQRLSNSVQSQRAPGRGRDKCCPPSEKKCSARVVAGQGFGSLPETSTSLRQTWRLGYGAAKSSLSSPAKRRGNTTFMLEATTRARIEQCLCPASRFGSKSGHFPNGKAEKRYDMEEGGQKTNGQERGGHVVGRGQMMTPRGSSSLSPRTQPAKVGRSANSTRTEGK